ncbi:MAG: hydrogenase iron-sulfur subunit [bacterium]
MSVDRDNGNGAFQPEILVLYCQSCVGRDVNLADSFRSLPGCKVRFLVMPCSSKIEVQQLVKLLEQGADGIQVVGCADTACKFLVGSTRAEKRVVYVRDLLGEIDFGVERVAMVRGTDLSVGDLMEEAMGCAERVRALGPNPMRKGVEKHPAERLVRNAQMQGARNPEE